MINFLIGATNFWIGATTVWIGALWHLIGISKNHVARRWHLRAVRDVLLGA